MSYLDRAWCFEECGNELCYRNAHKIPEYWKYPVDYVFFRDTDECEGYIEVKEAEGDK